MSTSEPSAGPPQARSRWKILRRIAFVLSLVVIVGLLALVWYVRTDSFRNMVRARLVLSLEEVTGGGVEVGKISVVPFKFRVEARDLTIHGTEPAGELPWARVDHLVANVKIVSVLQREYGFDALTLEHPVIHILVRSDGSTNQPAPSSAAATAQASGVQQLFAFSINHLQISRGELLWNDQRIPLDFEAHDVTGGMNYSFVRRNYQSFVRVGKAETAVRDLRSFTSGLQARMTLGGNFATLDWLEWSSGRSRLEASGRLDDFRNPKFTGSYNGRIDLADLASIIKLSELRAGVLDIGGKGTWSAADFLVSGKAAVRSLEWRDSTIFLRNAAGTANYSLSPTDLKLTDIEARLMGGEATGRLQVANWRNASERGLGKKLEKGSLNLKLRDLSVAALAAAVRSRRLPLEKVRLAGLAGGTVEANWVGSVRRNADIAFTLQAQPPVQVKAGEIPLTARAAGVYHDATDELELSVLDLASRTTQIRASGRLSASSTLRFSLSSTDTGEWQPVITAFSGPQLPVSLRGRAVFNGVASGKLRDFAISGHLQMNNFLTTVPAKAELPARQVHWDSLAADIQASPQIMSARNGILKREAEAIRFDTTAYLQDGQFTDASPFTAHIEIRKGEAAELLSLAGYTYPISGSTDLSLTASGTRGEPHGEGQLQLTNGVVYGQPVSRLTSDLHFGAGEAQLNNGVVLVRNGRLTGGGAFNPQTHAFRFNLNGTTFDLLQFQQLQRAGVRVEGRMEFTAHGEGTLEAPVINADVQLLNLAFDHEHAGDLHFEAVTHGADMQLKGRSNFEQSELFIGGNVHLRDDWPAQLSLRFDRLDVDSLLRTRLGYHLTSHVPLAGVMQLNGPLRKPTLINATADLTSVAAELENFSIHNEGPVHFTIDNRVLALNRLRLVGDGTDISAQGNVQLSGDYEVDLRSDGRLNLKLLETLGPGISSSGLASVSVRVSGTFHNPSLVGKAEVSGGAISSIDLPNGLSEMNGTLAFNQDRLQIQKLSARVGGGTVDFSGFMAYSPHVTFNINAMAHDVRLRPAGLSATSDADLHLVGTPRDSLLSGEVTILKLNLTPGFDFARYLEGIRQTTTLPTGNSVLNNVRMDIHVVTTPELQMEAASAKVSGDADLRLRGTLVRPLLLGRVDIMEGDVYFSGTKYRLERGEITFTGPTGIKPTLDLEATTRVRDYDITLGVNGTPDKLNVTYRSEPPLPSADIVALLALGHTENETALANSTSQSVSQQASTAILSQALNATLSSRSQRLFGISRIKVDPNGLNTETTPTRTAPAVTIEEQVASNLTVTYSTEVSQTSQQVIQAEYNVSRNISIVALRDQNGVLSFDVRLRQRRK